MNKRHFKYLFFTIASFSCNQEELEHLEDENKLLREEIEYLTFKVDSFKNLPEVKLGELLDKDHNSLSDTNLISQYYQFIEDFPNNWTTDVVKDKLYLIDKNEATRIAKNQTFGKWKLNMYWDSWTNQREPVSEDRVLILKDDYTYEFFQNGELMKKGNFKFDFIYYHENEIVNLHISFKGWTCKGLLNYSTGELSIEEPLVSDGGAWIYEKMK